MSSVGIESEGREKGVSMVNVLRDDVRVSVRMVGVGSL